LARLIANAKGFSDAWLVGKDETLTFKQQLHLDYFSRVADAVLPLGQIPDRARFLNDLTMGDLDILERNKSKAKDVLWEIELWSILKRQGHDANLAEPDIVVDVDGCKIGIACKKLYSERNVEKVLSQAVGQIEPSFEFGIAAINLDDRLEPDHILRQPTKDTVCAVLGNFNCAFLQRNDRHFRKYLAKGRLVSALVSTCVLADTFRERTRIHSARQWTLWTIPGLPENTERLLNTFYGGFLNYTQP